ncbi:hypothetical protein J6590_072197 [Homalodisca vitripennis]|nr:hypothetical protein J6590_072197 [Homalodisca vitripennis]
MSSPLPLRTRTDDSVMTEAIVLGHSSHQCRYCGLGTRQSAESSSTYIPARHHNIAIAFPARPVASFNIIVTNSNFITVFLFYRRHLSVISDFVQLSLLVRRGLELVTTVN